MRREFCGIGIGSKGEADNHRQLHDLQDRQSMSEQKPANEMVHTESDVRNSLVTKG